MSDVSLIVLLLILIGLICFSGFFSGSETGMMSLNRYRLRHLAKENHRAALRTSRLLDRMDRLLGVILIGNTFANILASAVATVIAVRLFGDVGVFIATVILTFIILIFAEIAPKTLAAIYSQQVAFAVSLPLSWLLRLLYPVVFFANLLANSFLRLLGVKVGSKKTVERLSREELRTVVTESTGRISSQYQEMLLRILDLGEMAVDDVMIPRNKVQGIDLNEDWDEIIKQLQASRHTRLPVYDDDIDKVHKIVNVKRVVNCLLQGELTKESLLAAGEEVYFVPEGTPLTTQLINFRKEQQRLALVVDEYGDVQGLVTIEDILEEIVGELSAEEPSVSQHIKRQSDGSYLVDGKVNIRELNRLMQWELPTDEAKTLSGCIIEYLQAIPDAPVAVVLNGHRIEVVEIKDNLVTQAKIAAPEE